MNAVAPLSLASSTIGPLISIPEVPVILLPACMVRVLNAEVVKEVVPIVSVFCMPERILISVLACRTTFPVDSAAVMEAGAIITLPVAVKGWPAATGSVPPGVGRVSAWCREVDRLV